MEDDMNDSGEAPRSYEDLPEVESPWAEIIDLGTSMARAWIMMLAPDAYTRFGDQFLDTLRGTGEWLKLADARRARMRDPLTRLPWGEQVDLARCNNIQIDHLTLTRGWKMRHRSSTPDGPSSCSTCSTIFASQPVAR